jgi:hypothetical protein
MSCRDERGWREPESAPLSRKRGPSGVQYLFSNLLPYNARHLIAIEFDDQVNHDLLLLSPEIRKKAQRKAANVDEETSKLSPLPKTRGHNYSRYGMLPAKPPTRKGSGWVMWSSSREPPAKGLCVRVSWEAGIHKRSLQRWWSAPPEHSSTPTIDYKRGYGDDSDHECMNLRMSSTFDSLTISQDTIGSDHKLRIYPRQPYSMPRTRTRYKAT